MKRTSLFYIKLLAIAVNLAVFVFWGMFFLEHLSPFFNAGGSLPLEVWVIQSYHFLFLAGLLLTIKWNFAGALLTLVSSFLLFWLASGYFFFIFFPVSNLGTFIWLGIAVYNYKIKKKRNDNNIKSTEQL